MYQVGVTGGIGSGKTLVCGIFEKLGVPVYHADIEARELMVTNGKLRDGIASTFGREIYSGNILNRKKLAEMVFADASLLGRLNALVHPVVRVHYLDWVSRQTDVPYVMEEAAILFESGASRLMDTTVMIYAPRSMRISRVMERDGVDENSVLERMKHQMDEEEKRERANHIILNDGTKMVLPQVIELHQWFLKNC